jgi:hypothetical protein
MEFEVYEKQLDFGYFSGNGEYVSSELSKES